jgi:hypothetical protein
MGFDGRSVVVFDLVGLDDACSFTTGVDVVPSPLKGLATVLPGAAFSGAVSVTAAGSFTSAVLVLAGVALVASLTLSEAEKNSGDSSLWLSESFPFFDDIAGDFEVPFVGVLGAEVFDSAVVTFLEDEVGARDFETLEEESGVEFDFGASRPLVGVFGIDILACDLTGVFLPTALPLVSEGEDCCATAFTGWSGVFTASAGSDLVEMDCASGVFASREGVVRLLASLWITSTGGENESAWDGRESPSIIKN